MPPKTRSVTDEPRSMADELLEALLDTRVTEALAKALSPFITLSIEEAIGKKFEGLTEAVRDLRGEATRLKKRCDDLQDENARLATTCAAQGRQLDDLECYSRNENIIIRGLPEQSAAERATQAVSLDDDPVLNESHLSVESTVQQFCMDILGVEVQEQDISIAHRLKAGKKETTRPIIVRFATRRVRNLVLRAKKKLKDCGKNIFISEHLTKTNSELFYEARKMLKEKKIFATWTMNGLVHVKYTADARTKAVVIKSRADFR